MLANDREAALTLATECSGHDCYSGSKHAIARWVRREAPQFARQGISLNAIAPGYIETPMTQAVAQSEEYGEAIKQFVASIPLGRPGTPEDIASLIGFYSPRSALYCRFLIYADGGHDALSSRTRGHDAPFPPQPPLALSTRELSFHIPSSSANSLTPFYSTEFVPGILFHALHSTDAVWPFRVTHRAVSRIRFATKRSYLSTLNQSTTQEPLITNKKSPLLSELSSYKIAISGDR